MLTLGLAGAPNATLIDRGNGMIYDDVLDITWLQDAGRGGNRNWSNAVSWANQLIFGAFDDWRLPLMDLDLDGTIVDCGGATEPACRDAICAEQTLAPTENGQHNIRK